MTTLHSLPKSLNKKKGEQTTKQKKIIFFVSVVAIFVYQTESCMLMVQFFAAPGFYSEFIDLITIRCDLPLEIYLLYGTFFNI